MPESPSRRVVLSWLSATAAVGCVPGSKALPTGASFSSDDSGTRPTGSDGSTPDTGGRLPSDTGDTGDTGSTSSPVEPDPQWACEQGSAELPASCTASSPQGEGPYYLEDVPEGDDMNRRGAEGTPLTVDLRVLGLNCVPAAGVVVDLWHADETEVYDMTTDHHCRGRLTTAEDGSVCFTTLRPPAYGPDEASRLPAHLHLHVLIDGAKVLTTQLYFSDCPYLTTAPPELICTPEYGSDGSQRVQANLVLPIEV